MLSDLVGKALAEVLILKLMIKCQNCLSVTRVFDLYCEVYQKNGRSHGIPGPV